MKSIHLIFLAVLLLTSGCGAWKSTSKYVSDSWKTTKNYISPPPEIDTTLYQFEDGNHEKLARLFTPVDAQLGELVHFVEDQTSLPSVEWIDILRTRFNWVDRVFVTDDAGVMLLMQPALSLNLEETAFSVEKPNHDISLHSFDEPKELSQEQYLSHAYYQDTEFRGLIEVGFDLDRLFAFCENPEELIVVKPGENVWSHGEQIDKEAFLAVAWEEILEDEVQGLVEVNGASYVWLVRYIGRTPLVYATKSVDHPSRNKSWWLF